MLIKPFMATVDASGQAISIVRHDLHGKTWKLYQLGLALGQLAPTAQVAAHYNGIPLTSTVTMQQSVFSNLPGQAPYAMESFMVGPPYMIMEAGDQCVCGVIHANSGDIFTVGAYVEEFDANDPRLTMGQ